MVMRATGGAGNGHAAHLPHRGNRLTIDVGSVLDVPAQVVVSSDDYQLTMGGGVSAAIRMVAGSALVLDAAKAVPRKAGDVGRQVDIAQGLRRAVDTWRASQR